MRVSQAKLISPGEDVQALIANGMDFLDKAIDEFEAEKYKHSIISFWTAVEILLKVPLVSEHWTLACTGKKISRSNYLAGDFQSVGYEDTCSRLKDVLEKPLSADTEKRFKAIQNHRNRAVHFFHKAFTEADAKEILAELASAWFALNRYLREDWHSVFSARHGMELAFSETRVIRGNRFYAAARLEHIRPELDALIAKGVWLDTCDECGHRAVVEEVTAEGKAERRLKEICCRVCSSVSRQVHLLCPDCHAPQIIAEGDNDFSCAHCETELNRYELLEEEAYHSLDEGMDSPFPAGCTSCMSQGSVCPFGKGYICTLCLAYYGEIELCLCCGHASDDVGENSYFRGCEFCDGDTRMFDD